MAMVRWNPFRELEEAQGRLSRLFAGGTADREFEPAAGRWDPALDIQETEQEFIVTMDVPEVKPSDVKVELQDGVLSIQGERKAEKEEQGTKYHRVEREYGRFARSFTVPRSIDPGTVRAECKNGVLHVHLPKAPASKPTTVDVKVA